MFIAVLSILFGFFLLIKGADWLVEGGSSIAKRFGISDLMIGLTIVSFGTSTPELLVNLIASFQGSADIAIGNIVGSNISNTLLILGVAAMITPLAVQRSTVFKEIPFGLLAAGLLYVMANDHIIDGRAFSDLSRSDGLAFLGFFIIFLYYTFGMKRENHEETTKATKPGWVAISMVIAGMTGLTIGGKFAVDGSIAFATLLGVSEALIGLTIVALGTSLPELAASAIAAYKGKADIAVGNVIGSNIFNIFWILGISALIRPLPFRPELNADLGMVVFCTVLLFFLIHNGLPQKRLFLWWKQKKDYIIRRWEGGILLACYVAYIAYISWRG